jgi:hypothetical protein
VSCTGTRSGALGVATAVGAPTPLGATLAMTGLRRGALFTVEAAG